MLRAGGPGCIRVAVMQVLLNVIDEVLLEVAWIVTE